MHSALLLFGGLIISLVFLVLMFLLLFVFIFWDEWGCRCSNL
ncbi:E5 protein [Giraffa camelopardalis papillomavirus 1]|uniref:E5 protein n=1 Tax=Giraffa camelopardalis papillomavirus 1 TaxID=1922325 RepID=A0A1L3GV90_9PAPI|nr:E5 protein [Giraffa camelopardalis papillomavirus 1]APG30984.1 E5 protein [Giraffa camelopardalis papillomavirus 1]